MSTWKLCEDGKYRNSGRDVACPHMRVRYCCVECAGGGICKHNIQRSSCVKCAGTGICRHKRRRRNCLVCSGCEHGRVKRLCSVCSPKEIYLRYKHNAVRRNLAFELSLERFAWLVQQPCLYCKAEPALGVDRGRNDYGYTLLNSVPCCSTCNYAKNESSAREFVEYVAKVYAQNSSWAITKNYWEETRTTGPDVEFTGSTNERRKTL